MVYIFPALIKHEIRMKFEKCIVSVSYFVVCFAKTLAKYARNAKYEKCIAGLKEFYLFIIQENFAPFLRAFHAVIMKKMLRYF